MRILGLDPGTGRLGYAIIEAQGGRVRCLACGCAETALGGAPGTRLQELRNSIRDLVRRFRPEQAILERLYFSTNVRTALAVAEARGMLLTLLADAHLPVLEVSPQEVKSGVTGKGNAPKPQVQRMVALLFDLAEPPQPDDAADALAIAYTGTARVAKVSTTENAPRNLV